MTESEWMTCEEPFNMVLAITTEGPPGSRMNRQPKEKICTQRTLKLFGHACWQIAHGKNKDYAYHYRSWINDETASNGGMLAAIWTERPSSYLKEKAQRLREVIGPWPFDPTKEKTRGLKLRGKKTCHLLKVMQAVAEKAYKEDDYTDLPVFADMLEEVTEGQASRVALQHLRGYEKDSSHVTWDDLPEMSKWMPLQGPHCEGCWVLERFWEELEEKPPVLKPPTY